MLTDKRPIEHFKELVSSALVRQKVKADELAEFYLSNLLADFVDSRKLSDEPLSLRYLRALKADKEEQGLLLKRIGDYSLLVSGFFSDSLKRKVIDLDFYIQTGTASYGRLAGLYRTGGEETPLSSLFTDLALNFRAFVDVLSEVSEASSLTSPGDILRIYERWLRTGSRRAATLLKDLGIVPQTFPGLPIH